MHKTFYTFLMTQRNPDSTDAIAEFANNAFLDQSFPKQRFSRTLTIFGIERWLFANDDGL